MPKLPGISQRDAVRALIRAGFYVDRQSGHVVMKKDGRTLVIPRNNPINPFTMAGIICDAGMTIEEFKRFL